MPVKVGDAAPPFTLSDHNGRIFDLAEILKSRLVLLIFYPYDQSPDCTEMLCAANEQLGTFNKYNIEILGINNASAESHLDFAEKKFLRMPLLSDEDYKVAKAYNCLFQIGPIRVIRRTVVGIDSAGVIRYYERGLPKTSAILDNFRAALAADQKDSRD